MTIQAAPAPTCAVCGSEGEFLYSEQKDLLFGSEGKWNVKRCLNITCRLLWLDPMPTREEIWKAYVNYYTHAPQNGTGRGGFLKNTYRAMKRGYWSGKFGYDTKPNANRALGKLFYLFPLHRRAADIEMRFLKALPGGRLLDVGCGSGDWLVLMRDLGWKVEGMDFDEAAVKVAQSRGLLVKCGGLEQQQYPAQSFDVVTMSHVIEHVPDPLATLVECRRILRRGGKLVLFTPNSNSIGHRLFGALWRGLEPPRHLHILSPDSMQALLIKAGFHQAEVGTYNSKYVWEQSCNLWGKGRAGATWVTFRPLARLLPEFLTMYEQLLLKFDKRTGECLWAMAVRT